MTTSETYFNNPEDERSLLGSILMHNEVLDKHKIFRDLFYEEAHRQIFDEVLRIRGRGSSADMPTVALALPVYSVQIASLTNFLTGDTKGLIQRLRDCVQARGVAQALSAVAEMQADLRPPSDVVEEATRRVMQLSEGRDVSYRTLSEVAIDTIKEIKARKDCPDTYSGVESGLERLDCMTDGFQDGEYIIVGARPSVGKTALALTFALAAARKGERVAFISLEMRDTALFKRILAAQSNVSMNALRTGTLGPRQMSSWSQAAQRPHRGMFCDRQ
jgi:replicative DNA helicase